MFLYYVCDDMSLFLWREYLVSQQRCDSVGKSDPFQIPISILQYKEDTQSADSFLINPQQLQTCFSLHKEFHHLHPNQDENKSENKS